MSLLQKSCDFQAVVCNFRRLLLENHHFFSYPTRPLVFVSFCTYIQVQSKWQVREILMKVNRDAKIVTKFCTQHSKSYLLKLCRLLIGCSAKSTNQKSPKFETFEQKSKNLIWRVFWKYFTLKIVEMTLVFYVMQKVNSRPPPARPAHFRTVALGRCPKGATTSKSTSLACWWKILFQNWNSEKLFQEKSII